MYQEFDHFHLPIDQDLALVAPQLQHSKAIFDLIQEQRTYLGAWLSWVNRTQSIKDVRRFIRESQAFNEGGQRLTAFIHYRDQIVGSVGFVRLDMQHKKGEIGYWISELLQGRGLVTLSCLNFIDYAFTELELNRVEIRVLTDNEKSRGIPLRLGFRHEGRLRQSIFLQDKYHDMDVFAMLFQQWEEQKNDLFEKIKPAL